MLTSGQIAAFTGISDRTIRDWKTKEVIPESADMAVIVTAIVVHLKSQIEEAHKPEGADPLYLERTRETKAKADKLELEIAEKEGTLVVARNVVLVWSKYIQACKAKLNSIPSKLAEVLAEINNTETIRGILETAIDEATTELGDGDFVRGSGSAGTNSNGVSASPTVDD